jgi:hypothetical protein
MQVNALNYYSQAPSFQPTCLAVYAKSSDQNILELLAILYRVVGWTTLVFKLLCTCVWKSAEKSS